MCQTNCAVYPQCVILYYGINLYILCHFSTYLCLQNGKCPYMDILDMHKIQLSTLVLVTSISYHQPQYSAHSRANNICSNMHMQSFQLSVYYASEYKNLSQNRFVMTSTGVFWGCLIEGKCSPYLPTYAMIYQNIYGGLETLLHTY